MTDLDDFTLFDVGLAPVPVTTPTDPTLTIDERFTVFHEANPWVYTALATLARDLIGRDHQRVGIGMLFEVLRWQHHRATSDPASDFKLNNDYRSRYARLLMEQEPDLVDRFETRRLAA